MSRGDKLRSDLTDLERSVEGLHARIQSDTNVSEIDSISQDRLPSNAAARSAEVPRAFVSADADSDDKPKSTPETSENPVGIDARILELQRQLPELRNPIPQADTLIYLGRLGLENEDIEEDLKLHFEKQPLLVEHNKLIALNSPYFTKLLGPFFQTKRWKTLRPLVSDYVLPRLIKYIINMTPETEGMDAVEAIQDLYCPPRVLNWKGSSARWSSSATLVGGHDETDGSSQIEEYSRIRHVKSIERFMIALQGQNPKIDSAAKLYTTVMVSKPWNIQGTHPMTDWALGWLCADPNTRFIEALPEISLKMAEVMKCASLCKDAFGILVGEAVLDSAVHSSRPLLIDSKKTVYQRFRGDIEEDWQNRIQHARNSFTERIQKTFDDLAGDEMAWILNLRDIQEVQQNAALHGKMNEFVEFLELFKLFVRSSIYKVMCSDYKSMTESWESSNAGGDELYPRNTGTRTWPILRAQERIFTRWFWKMLGSAHFGTVTSTTDSNHGLIMTCYGPDGPSAVCLDHWNTSLLKRVTVEQLDVAISKTVTEAQDHFIDPSIRWRATRRVAYSSGVAQRLSGVPEQPQVGTTGYGQRPLELASRYVQQSSVESLEVEDTRTGTQQPSLWGSHFFPREDTSSEGQRPDLRDSDSLRSSTRCTYWACSSYMVTASVNRICSSCKSSFCYFHTKPSDHACAGNESISMDTQSRQGSNNDSLSVAPLQDSFPLVPVNAPQIQEDNSKDSRSAAFDSWRDVTDDNKRYKSTGNPIPLLRRLLSAVAIHLNHVAWPMLTGVRGGNLGGGMFDYHLTQTLTCLEDEETKFLPLWGDGLDDGSGGVFSDHVPAAVDHGTVLGPGGHRYAARSEGSEFSFASGSLDSTVNTSTLGHDGYRDTLPRRKVVTVDDSDDSSIGGWSYIQGAIDNKKGKQPVLFTPDESEVATTLGALEDASLIDLGIKAQTDQLPTRIVSPMEAGIKQVTTTKPTFEVPEIAANDDEDQLDDIFMDTRSDNEAFDSDDDDNDHEMEEDSDIDIIDASDLMSENGDDIEELQASVSASASMAAAAAITAGLPNKASSSTNQSISNGSKTKTPANSNLKPKPAWENQESMANVVYVYKGGNGDNDDDDLMTRI